MDGGENLTKMLGVALTWTGVQSRDTVINKRQPILMRMLWAPVPDVNISCVTRVVAECVVK